MEQRNKGTKKERNKGTKEQRNRVKKEQRNNGTTEQRNKGTKEQRNKGTKKLKVHPIGSGITRSPGLFFTNFHYNKIVNRKNILHNKFIQRRLCQNLQLSELK